MAVTVTAVVPTVGASPLLGECLRALRAQRIRTSTDEERSLEIILVRQGPRSDDPDKPDLPELPDLSDGFAVREIRLPRNLGFAAATNRGIAAAASPFVATVNDDVVVQEGWLAALLAALDAAPRAAAAQGVNLQVEPPSSRGPGAPGDQGLADLAALADRTDGTGRVDGWGLDWDRAFQAVQLGHGGAPPDPAATPREVFGVSATAAVYRRATLLQVARQRATAGGAPAEPGPSGDGDPGSDDNAPVPTVFDPRLESYYEDVDLACRLRAAGFTAVSVPAARAHHAGSLTGRRLGARRWRLLYGNRYAVAAAWLGRSLWRHLPRMVLRDLADLVRTLTSGAASGAGGKALGIVTGWGRAARLLLGAAHRGAAGTMGLAGGSTAVPHERTELPR